MGSYNFHTLSGTDFEILVRDLLNARERKIGTKIEYHSFKEGKDGGIDLLYSTTENVNEIIVQAKHYYKSGLTKLYDTLYASSDNELQKIKKLSPQPSLYMIATSLELSKANKQKIQDNFENYIKTINDILGNEDINMLLSEFSDVEKLHFKLWFNSSTILAKILNFAIEGRNEFENKELDRRIIQYVDISNFQKALNNLRKNKIIIITGNPGLGKTSLAEMLLYKFLGEGAKLHYIYDDIKDIETQLTNDSTPQVFYFDDFLGSTEPEMEKAKSTESYIIKLIKRIEKGENKHLILTTRKFILESNLSESEKLRLAHLEKFEYFISTKSLKNELKLQIIKNHCEIHQLEPKFQKIISKESILSKLLNVEDFSPRFIDLFTNPEHLYGIDPENYEEYIINSLNNPVEIWGHAFEKQIDYPSRLFLFTLYSFGDNENMDVIKEAFTARIDWEVKNNNYIKGYNEFKDTVRKLERGFIDIFNERDVKKIRFRSPSLIDYIKNSMFENPDILASILDSSIFLEQHFNRFRYFLNAKIKYIPTLSNYTKLYSGSLKLKNEKASDYKSRKNFLTSFILMTVYKEFENCSDITLELVKKIDWDFLEYDNNRAFTSIYFKTAQKNRLINKYFAENFHLVIEYLLSQVYDYDDLEETIGLFSGFNIIESDVIRKLDVSSQIQIEDNILEIINNYLSEKHEDLVEDALDSSEPLEMLNEIKDFTDKINMDFDFNLSPDYHEFESTDWSEITSHNNFTRLMEKDD